MSTKQSVGHDHQATLDGTDDVRKIRAELACIAHELNNLFQACLGSLELVSGADDEQIERVRRALERGHLQVRQLWLLADRRDRVLQEPGVRQPLRLLHSLCALFRAGLSEAHILEEDLQANLGAWPLSAGELQQVTLNLLGNASKATGPAGRITLIARHDEDGMHLAVRDDGPGFTQEARERALGGLSLEERSGGLGLWIVRGIALRYGGALTIDSSPGQGSEVAIHLPHRAP